MDRLTSIMQSDRDQDALMGAMADAFAEASQADNNFSYRRGHAPSGFEVDSIDIAFREKQSSITGKTNEDDDDENEEYVALSQYEVDADDLLKMNE